MDRLVSRVRRLSPLRTISDALLLSLLSQSESQPDNLQQGVVLFEKGESTCYWYLLVSGEVQLYRPSNSHGSTHIRTLLSGAIFGELGTTFHTCSALVSRPSQLVRISQTHFLSIYNKHGDHLQPFIVVVHDLTDDIDATPDYPIVYVPPVDYNNVLYKKDPTTSNGDANEKNFIEISNKMSPEKQIVEAGEVVQRAMRHSASHLIRDVVLHNESYRGCMAGNEMVDWLLETFISHSVPTMSRFQMTAIWQILLEQNVLTHVAGEQKFVDKHVFYRWTSKVPQRGPPTSEDVAHAISFLGIVAPETLFRIILSKPGFERNPEELELVYEELMHIKAFSHLSTMVKRQLSYVVELQQFAHAGSIVFRQGDRGNHWYIVLKGGVEVSIHGKGPVCALREGDDFGKLALVNDLPRAATITTLEDDSQFLVVDKHHFNQILREVEANTVRLREFGEDVLVLEKIDIPRGAAVDNTHSFSHCGYSVMAGRAEKILEYVLETRIDAHSDDLTEIDVFLEDFILTHEAFMSTNAVCNFLKSYYFRPAYKAGEVPSMDEMEEVCSKRRVVKFVTIWSSLLRLNFFLHPAANSFIEELYCHVIDDQKRIEGMRDIVVTMTALRSTRESVQRILARHPATVLDCGVLSAHMPTPILPTDICNQIIHLSDTTCFVLSIRLDKTAGEICELSRRRLRNHSLEPLLLVEVKSNGEKIIFAPTDRAIPTMLSLNSKLYVVFEDEVNCLDALFDQNGPTESVHSSILQLIDAHELAHQLFCFHIQLVQSTHTCELISQVIGRESFPAHTPFNLDLLVRRFNEVQYWATSEVLLATDATRVEILKKFIKIAAFAKQNQDLLTTFAIILGLSHISVSRLSHTWNRLSSKVKKQFAEFEALLDPSRNHRAYRMLIHKMAAPYTPFVPILLKDLAFLHQGNKSFYNGLVNFEKMHMLANVLRTYRQCKSSFNGEDTHRTFADSQSLIRNLRVIDNQRRLMQLSYKIEPRAGRKTDY
ncbi:unnamed protein product [Caenorhabditis auriculariae]|uniref:Uncharacterized protein n=1 Tax=Caenorhabditis auriculariae TaxID=2777116 RepID=A0A8S1GXE6_9PELO|nr:unnamed protein product [Caenorhabditis auriculariae]